MLDRIRDWTEQHAEAVKITAVLLGLAFAAAVSAAAVYSITRYVIFRE